MGSRRHIPPAYEGRLLPSNYHIVQTHPPLELFENKLAVQAAEISRLVSDNQKLATTHVALRQDYVSTQQEIKKLKEHILNIQTKSDVQIKIFLDKIAKMEADIKAGENVKKELEAALNEARRLVVARNDLTSQIHRASQEMEKARVDIKKLPEMLAELDRLREEHQGLRKTFEYEKSANTEKVIQMQIMEKDLVGMAREMERLRAEVLNVERMTHVPNLNNGHYMNTKPSFPPPMQGSVGYMDHYNKPYAQTGVVAAPEGSVQYSSNAPGGGGGGGGGGGVGPSVGRNMVWKRTI